MRRIIILQGSETFLQEEYVKGLVSKLSMPDLNYSCMDDLTDLVYEELCSAPVLDAIKVCFVRTPILKDSLLPGILERLPNSARLIIKYDKKIKKQYMSDDIELVSVSKYTSVGDLRTFIESRFHKYGVKISPDSMNYLIERSGYLVNDDISLQNIDSYVRLLSSCSPISKASIDDYVPLSLSSNIFDLFQMMRDDKSHVFEFISQLIESNNASAANMIGLILRQFRVSYKLKNYSDQKTAARDLGISPYSIKYFPTYLNRDELITCINLCEKASDRYRNGACSDSDALKFLVGEVMLLI